MPLLPPPDNTKAILAIASGAGLALVILVTTRSTLPHVGDNIHHLPHGGRYRDGTKAIDYFPPRRSYPGPGIRGEWYALLIILLISLYLWCEHKIRQCAICRGRH